MPCPIQKSSHIPSSKSLQPNIDQYSKYLAVAFLFLQSIPTSTTQKLLSLFPVLAKRWQLLSVHSSLFLLPRTLLKTQALMLRQANAWTEMSPSGSLPPARSLHSAVWANSSDGFFVFGGSAGSSGGLGETSMHWLLRDGSRRPFKVFTMICICMSTRWGAKMWGWFQWKWGCLVFFDAWLLRNFWLMHYTYAPFFFQPLRISQCLPPFDVCADVFEGRHVDGYEPRRLSSVGAGQTQRGVGRFCQWFFCLRRL